MHTAENKAGSSLHMPLESKIKLLLVGGLAPLAILVLSLLGVFLKLGRQYDRIVENLTIASEFSFDFKNTLDYKVYRYVASGKNFDALAPLEDVEQARAVVSRLYQTTTREDSRRRLKYIERFLNSLEKGIVEIRDEAQGYDWAIEKLDKNVRILTTLIQDKMQEYIYYETKNLAEVRRQTNQEVSRTASVIGGVSALVIVLVFTFALQMTNSITKPLRKLSENIRMVGDGDFTVRPVASQSDEIQALSDTFDSMVERIGMLMQNIRREQDNLRMAEFRLLQAQINPHFLYNTFDTVVWLAEDNQKEKVIQVITSLSSFFRTTLSKGEDVIAVGEEILHIRSYLEIQQIRYQDILTYRIDVPEDFYRYTIPKLTLQPLVENALYHGLKNKRTLGEIRISATLCNGVLNFFVWDNGVGLTPQECRELLQPPKEGGRGNFGLHNVRDRLQLYYGKDYGIAVESEKNVYTQMRVFIPAKESKPKS